MSIASTAVFFTLSSMYMHGLGYHTTVAAAAVQDAVERDGWSDASFDRMPSFWNPGHEHGSVNDSSDDDQGKPDHSMYISIAAGLKLPGLLLDSPLFCFVSLNVSTQTARRTPHYFCACSNITLFNSMLSLLLFIT